MRYPMLMLLLLLAPSLMAQSGNNHLFEPVGAVDRALETARRLDVPAQEYMVSVTTAETNKSSEQLRGIGFTFQPAGGAIGTLDEDKARVNLNNLRSGSRNRSTQMVRVLAGSSASIFIGRQVPIVTNQPLQTVSTMDAGKRLVIRAISPSGKNGVLLGLSTESSQIVPTGTSLPAKRQFVTETRVRAQFGKPVTIAMYNTSTGGTTSSIGGGGIIRFEENRRRGFSTPFGRTRRRTFGLGDMAWRKQGSVGVQRRRRRGGSSTIVTLLVRKAR